MLFVDGALGLLVLGLWVFCLVDVSLTSDAECRTLPKLAWLPIVLFLPDVGSVLWLIAGRPRRAPVPSTVGRAQPAGSADHERLGGSPGGTPEADAQFLRECRERAEAQRRRYREGQGK
jgi:hypothetical protein